MIFVFIFLSSLFFFMPPSWGQEDYRDPFMPLIQTHTDDSAIDSVDAVATFESLGLVLQGIIWGGEGNSQAIINGHICEEGE